MLTTGGPLHRLMARAAFVIGPDDTITYVEYVKEIAEQANCEAAAKQASK